MNRLGRSSSNLILSAVPSLLLDGFPHVMLSCPTEHEHKKETLRCAFPSSFLLFRRPLCTATNFGVSEFGRCFINFSSTHHLSMKTNGRRSEAAFFERLEFPFWIFLLRFVRPATTAYRMGSFVAVKRSPLAPV